jgi:hypothetical protein
MENHQGPLLSTVLQNSETSCSAKHTFNQLLQSFTKKKTLQALPYITGLSSQPQTTMSAEYKNVDLNKLAQDAERDLNSNAAKKGHSGSSIPPPFPLDYPLKLTPTFSVIDSGVDESVTTKFPGSTVEYGTGASNNRTIPESEGGSINPVNGQLYKAGDYAKGGVGAPEAYKEGYAKNHGGEDNVRGNTVDGPTLRQTGAK